MPARSFNRNAYRYGSVNGQENDDEIFVGASTAMYWEYDSRLGRRWNIDPEYKLFPHESPYACFHNNPNFYSDPLGNKPGNPDKEAKKFDKKVDKEFNKHKNEKGYTRDKSIEAVAAKLSDKNRYIVQHNKKETNSNTYAVYDIVEYYKSLNTEKTYNVETIVALPTEVLDKIDQKEDNQWYAIPQGAISAQINLSNNGATNGTYNISYDRNGETNETTVDLGAGKQQIIPLLRGTTFITIAMQIESIDKPGVSAKLDAEVTYQTMTKGKSTQYFPETFIGKPSMQDIKNRAQTTK